MTGKDLEDIGIDTTEYELYANDDQWVTPEDFDTYVGAEVNLPLYREQRLGKVTSSAQDSAGKLFGKANSNPILDTGIYQVEFPDGTWLNTLLM